jgi:DNA helicase-2/ATP-dependent DNA helicase PcrA
MMNVAWSKYKEVEEGTGHLVVLALAGSGKTKTLEGIVERIPVSKNILLCAFNNKIKEELKTRVKKSNTEVLTLHQLGYRKLRNIWASAQPRPTDTREDFLVAKFVPELAGREARQTIKKLVSLCKAYVADTQEQVIDIMISYDCEPLNRAHSPELYAQWVLSILEESRKRSPEITFDDMIYVPAHMKLRTGAYDFVLVDETQDLNVAQIRLSLNAIRPGGRIIAVGDKNQAIYRFRGADQNAIPSLIEHLNAKVLPLSISYRCPRAVVQHVKRYVPEFEIAPDAIPGLLRRVSEGYMKENWQEGDYVISRVNAPLSSLCLGARKGGIRAIVVGRETGETLKKLIKKSEKETIPEFLQWLLEWRDTMIDRLMASGKEKAADLVIDKYDNLVALSEEAKDVEELIGRIDYLFAEPKEGEGRLQFMSCHKAKGLENERVWLLDTTFRPDKSEEEKNLYYVGCTRSLDNLWLVSLDSRKKERKRNGEEDFTR